MRYPASENVDFFMEPSSSRNRNHNWKIPALNAPIYGKQVMFTPLPARGFPDIETVPITEPAQRFTAACAAIERRDRRLNTGPRATRKHLISCACWLSYL